MLFKFLLVALLSVAYAEVNIRGGNKVNIGGKEYFFSTEELSWTKASDKCHGMGMKMLALESFEEDTAISNYMGTLEPPPSSDAQKAYWYYWTGGMEVGDTPSTSGVWMWADLQKPMEYVNWAGGEPNPFGRAFCVYLSPRSLSLQGWLDGDCSAPWNFICEAY